MSRIIIFGVKELLDFALYVAFCGATAPMGYSSIAEKCASAYKM